MNTASHFKKVSGRRAFSESFLAYKKMISDELELIQNKKERCRHLLQAADDSYHMGWLECERIAHEKAQRVMEKLGI